MEVYMNSKIKELRESCNMTQREFSEYFRIPLSTLRKWEQGESNPPSYLTRLMAYSLPSANNALSELSGLGNKKYYYNANKKTISDTKGNEIKINIDLSEVNKNNLEIYLEDMFNDFYSIQKKFEEDCKYDLIDGITWSTF